MMLGPILIAFCATLWATDALFRAPLAHTLDPGSIVFLEHVFCVTATLPMFLLRRRETRELGGRGWAAVAFIGVMGSAFATFFFTASFRYINPSVTILLQKLQPVFAVTAARALLHERPRRDFYAWGLVALVGAAMLSFPDESMPINRATAKLMVGIALALGAAACWGLSTVFGKWVTARVSFPVTSFLRFAFGLAGISALQISRLQTASLPAALDAGALRPILYMALIPGVAAMYLYYAGLRRTRASAAAFAEMVFPVAAVIINWRFLGQALGSTQLVGAGLLLAAVFFISRGMR